MTSETARTPLAAALRAREQLLLTFSIIPSPHAIELVSLAGFDGVIFDLEHGPWDLSSIVGAIPAARAHDVATLVRVPFAQRSQIGALLDAGVEAVIVPHVHTAEMAAEIAALARFAPAGARGANPWVRAAGYGSTENYFARENERVSVILQIEGQTGLDNAAAIAGTPGVDAVFAGPVDLSHAFGVPGQLEHPLVLDAVATIARVTHDAGKAVAVFCATPAQVVAWRRRDVDVAVLGIDAALMLDGLRRAVTEVDASGSTTD